MKLLHASDLHLDSPFQRLSMEQAMQRRRELRELPGRLVDWANDHGAQLMLLAGDLFDSDRLFSQPAQMLAQALGWMASGRERLRRMEKKATSIEEKMEDIRVVNRAKCLLIEQLRMTEKEAHRFIEKQAMDRCVTKRAVAENIISTYK